MDALAHVIFLSRWSIVACVSNLRQNKVSLTDSKFTPDEICKFGCDAFAPILSGSGLKAEGLSAIALLGSLIDVLEGISCQSSEG